MDKYKITNLNMLVVHIEAVTSIAKYAYLYKYLSKLQVQGD